MNIDHIQGTGLLLLGRVQAALGRALGSHRLRRRGVGLQLQGQARRCIGDVNRLLKPLLRRARSGGRSALPRVSR